MVDRNSIHLLVLDPHAATTSGLQTWHKQEFLHLGKPLDSRLCERSLDHLADQRLEVCQEGILRRTSELVLGSLATKMDGLVEVLVIVHCMKALKVIVHRLKGQHIVHCLMAPATKLDG